MEKLKTAKIVNALNPQSTNLSRPELQRQIGHRIRRPLIHIIDRADSILSLDTPLSPNIKTTLGFITGEAYQMLEMYDWMLALFELTLNPTVVSPIDTTTFISTLCRGIEMTVPADLLGYRLIWSVPDALPPIAANDHLLQHTLHRMIRLLGHDMHSNYVQLDAQVSNTELVIQTCTTITDIVGPQVDFEYQLFDAVARACGGRFEHVLQDQTLSLTLYLPIAL